MTRRGIGLTIAALLALCWLYLAVSFDSMAALVIGTATLALPVIFGSKSFWTDRVRWTVVPASLLLLFMFMMNAGGGM